ncbi:beta-mannosidase [Cellulomonas bogoriensis 69B4 = DSM 16987]|uniref:beta-mannosidase n=2 Tax=Cellulomonas bogoriensis TaxID=301388 RepID=A0A0A0BZD2_9CELL|nr:beta-mannosidase [Cellulomonas bogoriensis 69B4 = DSM 16987]
MTHVPGTTLPAFHTLHDGWALEALDGPVPERLRGKTVPAQVPGSAHTDLLAAGLIPDPYVDRNEEELVWAHRTTWRYATDLHVEPPADDERVDLVMRGLDTVATVAIDGHEVLRTVNQHRSHRVDVRDRLASGAARLEVTFASALEHAEAVERELGRREHVYPHPFNMVRKMACSFGWDWGPDLQTAGMWRPVGLERWRVARLAQVRPLVTVEPGQHGVAGTVTVHVDVERSGLPAPSGDTDEVPLRLDVRVQGPVGEPGGRPASATVELAPGATSATVAVVVPDVALWWPRGYGAQPRYDLTVELATVDGHDVLARVERRIGFRSVHVDTEPDEHGTPFTVHVNGRPVFVKGANWIPDDHFLTRVDRDRYARRIDQAAAANLNLLRIWGGGIYEDEDFYDLCDERGMLVWQDFLFACASYPEEEPLRGEVEAEARENVVRLMSHPSLVVWNGANENIWGFVDWGWPLQLQGRTWGLGYYTELLPRVVAELDPTRPYSDNSPFSPHVPYTERHPNDPDHGTHHQWECWNRQDYAHYRDDVPRFCSEFGWQGPATWATLTRAVPPDALHKESPAFLLHQKAEDGNGKLDRGLGPHLPVPEDFEDWHWATQLNQARAVRHALEHYRSWWPRTAGVVVWQLNDCWPVTSWAAVDGDERLKPLWYALRSAYAERVLTVQPRGGRLCVVAVNDTDQVWSGALVAGRTSLDGVDLARASLGLDVPAREVQVLPLPADVAVAGDPNREILVVQPEEGLYRASDEEPVRAVHLWVEDKDLTYHGAPFTTDVQQVDGGYRVVIRARAFLRDATVLADKVADDARVDRQLVTLLAGEEAVVTVRTDAHLDPQDLVSPRVLRSVNGLVAGGAGG